MLRKVIKFSPYVFIPYGWYKLSKYDKDTVRNFSYNKGLVTSQKFKRYSIWDNYIEPLIIKQFSIIFIGGHSFIEGLASDNLNKNKINKYLDELNDDIETELKYYDD